MRVRITFKVKNKGAIVPFHHQYLISQVINGLILSSQHLEYNTYPDYSFSGIKGQTKISKEGLQFHSSKVTLVISSPSKEFLKFLLGRVFSQKQLEIGALILLPEHVDEEITPSLEDVTKFICISPLVPVRGTFNDSEGKRFIEPSSDEFSDYLFDSTINRLENSGVRTDDIADLQKFQIVPDEEYLNKIKESQKKFARVYTLYDQDTKYEIRGYTFPFTLYAPEEIQNFLFTCGIGNYSSKGFGMLDIAHSNPSERVKEYDLGALIST